jgi:2-dehydro-3-deoxyglucarate aldolase/4-hydroxy-2-oxoheptanedioate aldolase
MLENKVKQALQRGEAVFGTGLSAPVGVGLMRILANARLDWLFVDLEHGSSDMNDLITDLQVADILGMVSVVRVPDLQYFWIARCLDMGALSVMVPRVESREQAEYAVQCAKYPPQGRRGMGSLAALGFASVSAADAVRISNEQGMIVTQIETLTGVSNAEAIAAVPGVDVLFIGPLDLSISLGTPGNWSTPEWMAEADRVLAAAQKHGKSVGIVCTPEQIRFWFDKGVRMFSVGSAMTYIRSGIEAARAEFDRQVALPTAR